MNEIATTRQNRLASALCLLLALALAGGAVGSWVYRSVRQREAVEAVQKFDDFGGKRSPAASDSEVIFPSGVYYDHQLDENLEPIASQPPGPAWLRDPLGIDFVATVRAAHLTCVSPDATRMLTNLSGLRSLELDRDDRITTGLLPQLKDLPELEKLVLYGLPMTADDLAFLPDLPRLQILEIKSCGFDIGAGLKHVVLVPNLHALLLRGGHLHTAADLQQLERATRLAKLELSTAEWFNDAAVHQIAQLPQLYQLQIEELMAPCLTDAITDSIGRMTRLRRLALIRCDKLTDAGLTPLSGLKDLEQLTIEQTFKGQFTHQAIDRLRESLPNCRIDVR